MKLFERDKPKYFLIANKNVIDEEFIKSQKKLKFFIIMKISKPFF